MLPQYLGPALGFADCSVVPQPTAAQLADIAIASAQTWQAITGEEPRVAMLSFSSNGSARHPNVANVQQATEIVRERAILRKLVTASDEISTNAFNPQGKTVLVEFSDYNCGFCRKSMPEVSALLKSDPFSSRTTLPDSAEVASASTIPNTDARNIPLRVKLTQGTQSWQDEVLMIREGQCWAVDDVRYIGGSVHAPAGTLRQSIENR